MPTNKKSITVAVALCILAACIEREGAALVSFLAFAQGADSVFTTTANAAVIITSVMEMLAFMIFHFLQLFLDPLFIMNISETEGLRNIWKYSRDIMNILFAFMLIAAGIYTVVTGNKEMVNQRYKKFIIAVILVNFSWFFPRVILDVANVLTATIYQLPAGLSPGGEVDCRLPPKEGEAEGKPCQIITDVKYFRGCKGLAAPEYITKLGIICYKTADWSKNTNTAYGILNGLVVNFAQLPELTRVLSPDAAPGAAGPKEEMFKEYLIYLVHILFVVVLMTMLFLPLVAMFVVFLVRIPIMWVTIAFMPFMFLGFVMGDILGQQFDTMKIFRHYVTAAFLPTAVAVPFAAGFLILAQVSQMKCPDTVRVLGLCDNTGPLLVNINSMWGLLMLLIGFFIIWMGFWMALKIDPIYESITSKIKSFGETVGSTALKLPLSVPVLPIGPGGKMESILGVDDKLRSFSANLSAGQSPLDSLKAAGESSGVIRQLSDKDSRTNRALREIANQLKAGDRSKFTRTELKVQVHNALSAPGGSKLQDALKAAGLNPQQMTADDIVRRIDSTSDSLLRTILQEMDANAPPPAPTL